MAYPQAVSVTTTGLATKSATQTINLPGTTVSGRGLLMILARDGAGSNPAAPSGWTELHSSDTNLSGRAVFLRETDGADGSSVNVDIGLSACVSAIVVELADWNAVEIYSGVGGPSYDVSSSPDPSNLSPSWGADDNLWIAAVAAVDDNGVFTSAPANFTDLTQIAAGGAINDSAECAVAFRELNASSLNPGTFSMDEAEGWVAFTIAVQPGTKGPSDSATPTNIGPGIGSMALSGNAANVDVPANVAPGLETVAINGQPVELSNAETIAAGHGGLSLTGQPLTVESPANIQPGQGTYGITGIAVSVLTSVEIAPALGSTALTGFDLSVLADVDIAAGIGSLSLNGFSVSVDDEQITSINPGAGSIALAGEIVGLSAVSDLTPGIGSLALSGEAVSVESGFTLSPGVGSITCAGMAVTLDASALITPGLAELALMGQAANVAQPEDISPATASLAISGQTASIYNPVSLSIDIGGIAVTGLSVSLELIEGDGPEPFTGLLLMSKQENVYLSGKKEHIYVASKVKSTLVTAIK